jgi:hypothetical protein
MPLFKAKECPSRESGNPLILEAKISHLVFISLEVDARFRGMTNTWIAATGGRRLAVASSRIEQTSIMKSARL